MAQSLGEQKASGEMGRDRRQRKGVGRFAGKKYAYEIHKPLEKRHVFNLFISLVIISPSLKLLIHKYLF